MVWNERMLTVEDTNSIINHFNKAFVDYYTLDTRLLTTVDTWFAWDFINVYRVENSISFDIRNSLWTGGYKVIDCNINNPLISISGNTIIVSGSGLEWIVLVLELSPEFSYNSIFELDYQIEYSPVIRPFYEDIILDMGFIDDEEPVVGLSVTDIITGDELITDNNGYVEVSSSIDKQGEYDYVLEVENNSELVDYKYPYRRILCELPIQLINQSIYKDKINFLEFKFLFDDEYNITESMLFEDNDILLNVNGYSYSVESYENNIFSFKVPVTSDKLNITIKIGGNDYIENYTVQMSIDTEYLTVDNTIDLKTELESELSANTVLFNGLELDEIININDTVNIIFDGNIDSNLDNVFNVMDNGSLTLSNLNFTGNRLCNINKGEVTAVDCNFTHCASSIFTGSGNLTIKDSSFIDNYSCIDINGNVFLSNNIFSLSDISYLDTDTPAFVRCYQDLTIDYCQFNLELSELTTLGLSYVMVYLGKSSNVNKVYVSNLFENGQFPIKHNTSSVDIESENYHFTSIGNKCIIWTIEDTNTVYHNNLNIEYIGGE